MKNYKDILLITTLVFLGILSRTIFHIGPNIEFVTSISILSGYYLKNKVFAFIVPIFTLFFTDLIIGNTNIFLFTWSGFLLSPILGIQISKFKKFRILKQILAFEISGIVSTLIFFLWTNLGVVILGNMYSKDLYGLIYSYYNATPFLLNQLLGNMIIIPILYIFIEKLNLVFQNIFYSITISSVPNKTL